LATPASLAEAAMSRFWRSCILRYEAFMEVTIQHLGNVRFQAVTRGHRVICDQPRDNGGLDTGMTPPEFLLVSLGTCAGFYAAKYLESRKLSAAGLHVRVFAEKALQPARLAKFRIEVVVPGLDPAHEAGLLRSVKVCLIHNTLVNAPAIETVVRTEHDTIGIRAELAETTRN
jgi:putative redox protein